MSASAKVNSVSGEFGLREGRTYAGSSEFRSSRPGNRDDLNTIGRSPYTYVNKRDLLRLLEQSIAVRFYRASFANVKEQSRKNLRRGSFKRSINKLSRIIKDHSPNWRRW